MGLLAATLFAVFTGAQCSSIYFATAPSSVGLPKSAELTAKELPSVNEYILGLSSVSPSSWTGKGDLLSRPKALAVVSVSNADSLDVQTKARFGFSGGEVNVDPVNSVLEKTFGEKRDWVEASSQGIAGSELASLAQKAAQPEVKTKVTPLKEEIANIFRIANTLRDSGSRLSASGPAVFLIRVTGLRAAAEVSPVEYDAAVRELTAAIEYLTATLSTAYGDQAVVEVITHSPSESVHTVYKRQADVQDIAERIPKLRAALNVYVFTSPDYPAIFAIFAGLTIILALAVLFIAVGLWNMDPGKDSIIYRMTTTRMKKD